MKINKAQKRNILIVLFLLIVTAVCAGTLSACSSSDMEDQLREQGFDYQVTYDANGGTFATNSSATTQYVLVQYNSLTVEPGYWPSGMGELNIVSRPTRIHYQLTGWELVEEGEDGSEQTRPWNFSTDRVTEDITLRAIWERYDLLYLNAIIDGEEVNFQTWDITQPGSILSRFYNTNDEGVYSLRADTINRSLLRLTHTEVAGDTEVTTTYTPTGFYWLDEDGQRVEFSVDNAVYPENVTDLTLYADVLEGQFTFVTQETVGRSFTLQSDSNWYLLEDIDLGQQYVESDIISDYTSSYKWHALDEFNGIIYGNGYTISNVWVVDEVRNGVEASNYSMFGVMNGIVDDITFENVELTVYCNPTSSIDATQVKNIALLASTFGDGTFTDVVLEGCSITVINSSFEGVDKFAYQLAEDNNLYWIGQAQNQTVTGDVTFNGETEDDLIYLV